MRGLGWEELGSEQYGSDHSLRLYRKCERHRERVEVASKGSPPPKKLSTRRV